MADQRTRAWFEAKLGKVGASRIADVINFKRDGSPSKAREDYMIELVAERLTGQITEHYVTRDMQWGIDMESEARSAYEVAQGVLVTTCGFIEHPTIAGAGASPDGLVGDDGLVEFKCPKTETHIRTLLRGEADPQYLPQMQWQMACTGRIWCHFVSYDPRLPEPHQFATAVVHRDGVYICALEKHVIAFLREVDEMVQKITRRTA
jgi:putative phage-type endonuclease